MKPILTILLLALAISAHAQTPQPTDNAAIKAMTKREGEMVEAKLRESLTVIWQNEDANRQYAAWQKAQLGKTPEKDQLFVYGIYTGPASFYVHIAGKKYELGLRSDGVVVWREVK